MEGGDVAATGEVDAEGGREAFVLVIGGEAFAEKRCLDADDGVVARVVVGGAVEDLAAEVVLLEAVLTAFESLMDDEAEEAGELRRLPEPTALEDPFDLHVDIGSS